MVLHTAYNIYRITRIGLPFIHLFIFSLTARLYHFYLVWFKMYFCFWSNCIESAKKNIHQKLSTLMWPFNQSVASSALSVIIDFRQMLLAVVFNTTQILHGIQMYYFCVCFFVMFRYGNLNILYTKRTCEIHGLRIRSIGCLFSLLLSLCLLWNDVSTLFILFQYQHLNRYFIYEFYKHTTIDSSTTLCLYTTSSTQKTMNVYNKINSRAHTHLISASLSVYMCERECVYDVYCIRLFRRYILFIFFSLGCYLLWNRILNNESRACKSLPFIFVHFEQMLFEYYVM